MDVRSAYNYFLKGIHDFPGADDFAGEIARHGFGDVRYQRMTLGMVAIRTARKPG
jgi:demethylmenaquinone methyltransferase/2-methoxy-6-polyprenyl-1,4-benzoquinol methylase